MKKVSETHNGEKSSITIEGTKEETQILARSLVGTTWFSVHEGKAVGESCFRPLPRKKPDPLLFQHFTEGDVYLRVVHQKKTENDCAYFVQHIAGYEPDSYEKKSESMQAAGFDVLRSKRGKDGLYWEIWYLPGSWAFDPVVLRDLSSKYFEKKDDTGLCLSDHQDVIEVRKNKFIADWGGMSQKKKGEFILNWLLSVIRPGNVSVEGQNWGLSYE